MDTETVAKIEAVVADAVEAKVDAVIDTIEQAHPEQRSFWESLKQYVRPCAAALIALLLAMLWTVFPQWRPSLTQNQ